MFKLALAFLLLEVVFGVRYLGCWKDQSQAQHALTGFQQHVGGTNDVHSCAAMCKTKGFKYAGLHASEHCYCGNDAFARYGSAPDHECDASCPGDAGGQRCGAETRSAVYSTGYEGCYRDSETRAMDGYAIRMKDSDATIENCIIICNGKKFRYAGLQNARHCYCANEFASYGVAPESECNARCLGSSDNQRCGAKFRNSVYRTDVAA